MSNVEEYYRNDSPWNDALGRIRSIVLGAGFTETWKWRAPCYMYNSKNVAIVGRYKDGAVLSFLRGAILPDPKGLLQSPGPNSQFAKVLRFQSGGAVDDLAEDIRGFLDAARQAVEEDIRPQPADKSNLSLVSELVEAMGKDPRFKAAFESLTPGRQRAYNMFFESTKNTDTRKRRIQKMERRIREGFGMNDCVCGLTRKKPGCDGSHKALPDGKPF